MPRFYFDFSYGEGLEEFRDQEGQELEGLAAARVAAVKAAGELLRDYPERLWNDGVCDCTVRDESGTTVFAVHLSADGAPGRGASRPPPAATFAP